MNTSVAPQFASKVLQRGACGFALTSGLQLLAGTRGCGVVCCTTLPTALSLSTGPLLTLCSSSCLSSSLGLSRLFLNFLQSSRTASQSLFWMILLWESPSLAPHFLHMPPKSLPSVALSISWWTCARVTNRKSAVCGTRSLNFALVWPHQCLPAHRPLPHRVAQSAPRQRDLPRPDPPVSRCRRSGCSNSVPDSCPVGYCHVHCTSPRCPEHTRGSRTRQCRARGCASLVSRSCGSGFLRCALFESTMHFAPRTSPSVLSPHLFGIRIAKLSRGHL